MRYVLTLVFLLVLTGCFSSKITPSKQVTAAQDAVAKQEKKVDETYDELVKNEKNKRLQTSVLSQGIQYTLNQVTNPPIQVQTAKNLNERVVSIVGSPH